MKDKYYIYGCGGHAISVADIVLFNNPLCELIFVDKNAKKGEKIMSFQTTNIVDKPKLIYCGVGSNLDRKKIFDKYNFSTLISKDSYISDRSKIKDGTVVCHGAHIGPNVEIGRGCIINTNAVLDHEVKVGNFSHISVNCSICGKVVIGDNVFVGAGSVIKDKIKVCDNVIIGCGSVVVKNINQSGVYFGVPAKLVQ